MWMQNYLHELWSPDCFISPYSFNVMDELSRRLMCTAFLYKISLWGGEGAGGGGRF